MIQRFIKKALDVGISSYADQGLPAYQELFRDIWYLTDIETSGICDYFTAHPMQTHLGYPRSALAPDCVSVYIIETSQAQPGFAVGDAGGGAVASAPTADAGGYTPFSSSLWDHSLNIMALGFQQEATVYAMEIIKSIMIAAKAYFISVAVELPVMSISDVQAASQYEPENVWMRNMSVRVRREFGIANVADALQRAYKVAGIVGPPASPNTDGGPVQLIAVQGPARA